MRSILRKLDRKHVLSAEEYERLMGYVEHIGQKSPESYSIFYQQYAEILEKAYSTYLPRFWYDIDDLVNFLLINSEQVSSLLKGNVPWENFPAQIRPYLKYTFTNREGKQYLIKLANWLTEQNLDSQKLPRPREGKVVYIFEEGNPYKEPGLKFHFDRLARYSFISRLQSYRYLTRNKAHRDRIEVLSPDRLGATFTNKHKSLYFFIYLTEEDLGKAETACQVLNLISSDPNV